MYYHLNTSRIEYDAVLDHPHGDSSVYDAMVRLSQDWKLRHVLIEMHGNNGFCRMYYHLNTSRIEYDAVLV
jgi:hypothetical protein